MCKVLENITKEYELLITDMSRTVEDDTCGRDMKAFRDKPPIKCVNVTYWTVAEASLLNFKFCDVKKFHLFHF